MTRKRTTVRDRLVQILERKGWRTCDGGNSYESINKLGWDWVSLTLGKKRVEFYGRCYPAKEGWQMSSRSYTSLIKELK